MAIVNDTIVCDSVRLASWQANPAYDYNKELITPEISFWEHIDELVSELLNLIFGSKFAENYSEWIFVGIFVVIVLLISWVIYKKRPELFMRSSKKKIDYIVHEDNIYGVDFEAEIQKALSNGDYRQAIRLLYLQNLKYLSDKGLIDWQLFKTPTQYLYELKNENKRPLFRALTNLFLRVRYGNYETSREMYEEMLGLKQEIEKGGQE